MRPEIPLALFVGVCLGIALVWGFNNFLSGRASKIASENEKLRKFIDANECEFAHTKMGRCKSGQTAVRCTICDARLAMRA